MLKFDVNFNVKALKKMKSFSSTLLAIIGKYGDLDLDLD